MTFFSFIAMRLHDILAYIEMQNKKYVLYLGVYE